MNAPRGFAAARPAVALLALLAAAACTDSNDTSDESALTPRVTVLASEYSYQMPDEIQAGTATLTLRNEGAEPHHAQLARLKPGVTQEQLMARLRQDPEGAVASLLSFTGGPASVPPAGSQEVTLDLAPGDYVMLCFVPSADGVPHLAKGMFRPFRGTASPAEAQPPPAEGEVVLRDFSFTVPDVDANRTSIKVTNAGPQPHEMVIVRPAEDATLEDVRAFVSTLTGPPPFTDAGGMQALDPGASGWLTLDLSPGRYVMVCAVPDPATGRRHVDLGMIAPFEVQ
jgi:hypothetical protein